MFLVTFPTRFSKLSSSFNNEDAQVYVVFIAVTTMTYNVNDIIIIWYVFRLAFSL